jgi:hypothetical protein
MTTNIFSSGPAPPKGLDTEATAKHVNGGVSNEFLCCFPTDFASRRGPGEQREFIRMNRAKSIVSLYSSLKVI